MIDRLAAFLLIATLIAAPASSKPKVDVNVNIGVQGINSRQGPCKGPGEPCGEGVAHCCEGYECYGAICSPALISRHHEKKGKEGIDRGTRDMCTDNGCSEGKTNGSKCMSIPNPGVADFWKRAANFTKGCSNENRKDGPIVCICVDPLTHKLALEKKEKSESGNTMKTRAECRPFGQACYWFMWLIGAPQCLIMEAIDAAECG